MEYPQCACGDIGLNVCEMGDEQLCIEMEIAQMANIESADSAPIQTALSLSGLANGPIAKWSEPKCIHVLDEYELANGDKVYLSSIYNRNLRDWKADIGMYFDGAWDQITESFSYLIPWTDFGLPECGMPNFVRYIKTALKHLADGETLEIGCIGSHGRTGTFLACLDIASDNGNMTVRQAIADVRRLHCYKAIETEMQEWWISAFRATWNGEELPSKPRRKKVKVHAVKHDASKPYPPITVKPTLANVKNDGMTKEAIDAYVNSLKLNSKDGSK